MVERWSEQKVRKHALNWDIMCLQTLKINFDNPFICSDRMVCVCVNVRHRRSAKVLSYTYYSVYWFLFYFLRQMFLLHYFFYHFHLLSGSSGNDSAYNWCNGWAFQQSQLGFILVWHDGGAVSGPGHLVRRNGQQRILWIVECNTVIPTILDMWTVRPETRWPDGMRRGAFAS